MDKIDEKYIQRRILDSRKKWYIYLFSLDITDRKNKDLGIFEAENEREAYIKLFDKSDDINMKALRMVYKMGFFLFPKNERYEEYNRVLSLASINNKKDQDILDEMKYEHMKDNTNNDGCCNAYIKKFDNY